jgi:hypothetical protein
MIAIAPVRVMRQWGALIKMPYYAFQLIIERGGIERTPLE